jgi:hypothetical protein
VCGLVTFVDGRGDLAVSVHKGFKRQFKMDDGLRLIPSESNWVIKVGDRVDGL